jgi:hypothetical protein
MQLAILYDNGEFRIHAATCRDVSREAKRFFDTPWLIEAVDKHTVNVSCWADIAGDTTEPGTKEWHALCDDYASSESTYLPCCADGLYAGS